MNEKRRARTTETAIHSPQTGRRFGRQRPGLLPCALLLCSLILCLLPAIATATTETFAGDPGAPLDNATLGGANPATYGSLVYSYRNSSRGIVSNIVWAKDAGVSTTEPGLITAVAVPLDQGRELDITRSGGGTFNFTGIDLGNYSPAVTVTVQGYNNSGTKIFDGGSVSIAALADHWTTYTTGAPWSGVTEVRIVSSGGIFDPYLDNVGYSLSSATTGAASGITRTGATLNGTINGGGESNAVSFSYGTTTGYGSTATATPGTVSGLSNTAISAAVTGLTCNTTYHYAVTAAASLTVSGSDQTFTTSACNIVPTFVGATTSLTVLKDASATDIKSLLHVSDADTSDTLTWTQSAAPTHGTLSFASATASSGSTDITPGGTITYTPTAGYLGTDSFTVQVSDGVATATRTISVAVKTSQTINFANPGAQNFGTSPTLPATASSGLAVSFSSATTGVCTITSAGVLTPVTAGSCTVNADQAGDSSYAAAPQVSQTFAINAVAPGAPTIGTVTAGDQQIAVAYTAPSSTGGASITSYTATASPGGKTGTGSASPITVTGLTNGTAYTFTVTATNSAGVSAASAASASVTPKASQTIDFRDPGAQSFASPPTLTATATSGLTPTFTSSTTGVCTITSGGALTFLAPGTCTINADQAGNASYLAAITVSRSFAVSASVIALSPGTLPATVIGTAYSQTISANGGTAPYTFALTAGSLPTGVSLSSAGVLSGTPTVEGSFPITVTATDSSSMHFTGGQTYTFAVNPQTPVAGAVSATVAFNSSANTITLSISGGAPTSVAVARAASHGTAIASGVSITYTPATGYSGPDSFTYIATNAGGTSAAALVSITVNPTQPVAGAVSATVLSNSSSNPITLNIGGGAPASVAVASAPSHGTATASGVRILYTPATGYLGTDSFTYTATNAAGASAPAAVSILVQARPDPGRDANVQGLLSAQVDMANHFAKAQIGNFQSHLESLHVRPDASPDSSPDSGQTQKQSAGSTQLRSAPAAFDTGAGRLSSAPASGQTEGKTASPSSALSSALGGNPVGQELGAYILSLTKTLQGSAGSWSLPALNLNKQFADPLGTGLAIWTAGTISIGRNSDQNSRFTSSGVSAGSDFRINDKLVLGIGAGLGHEHQSVGSEDTHATGNNYSLMAYGSYQPLDHVFLDGVLGYNQLDFDMKRYVSAAGSYARSQRDGSQWFASLSGGYEFKNEKYLLSPYGRLDLVSTRLDQSTESGAGTYDLVYFEQTLQTTKLSLGMRGSVLFEMENVTAKPYSRIEFQHDFAKAGVADMTYADQLATGVTYQYDMGKTDRNNLVLGLGSDFVFFKSWELGLDYRFNRSAETQMQTFGALLRKTFTF